MATKDQVFGGLSTELEYMILALLPRRELKIARLVNKKWAVEAASLLFNTVEVNLLETERRKVNALIDGPPGGFLDSVKNLRISYPGAHDYTGNRLLRILGALPRDTLTTFECHPTLDQHTIGILLRTQSRLSHLVVSLRKTRNVLPGPNFVRGNLFHLRRLAVTVSGESHITYQGYATWFKHASELEDLCIKGTLLNEHNVFNGWTMPKDNALLKLRHLSLHNLSLRASVSGLPEQIHLPSLQKLILRKCKGTAALLESFAAAFSKSKDSALKVFEQTDATDLENHENAAKLLQALTRLDSVILGSFHGLTGIGEVGPTIRAARVSTNYRECNASELKTLSATCPNLELLCIKLVGLWLDFDYANLDYFELFPQNGGSSTQIELKESLEVLAGLPKLRTLCITNDPQHHDTEEAREWVLQLIADFIIPFLSKCGSPVQVVVFSPEDTRTWRTNYPMDPNGHTWPVYYYEKHTITHEYSKRRSVSVDALPIEFEEFESIEPYHIHLDRETEYQWNRV